MDWTLYPIAEFTQYQSVWDKLNDENTMTPLLSSDFVIPLINYFAHDQDRLAICGKIDAPLAMAVITKRKFGVWETLQPSQAPLGLWLHKRELPLDSLLTGLQKTLPFPALLFGITQQDPDLFPRPANKDKLRTLDYIQTARVTLNGSFDEYWSQRGKNLRQNLKRQRNLLQREGIATTLKTVTDKEDIEGAIIDYGRIESAGWKNAGGTAIHIDNLQGKFYRDMMINFCLHQNALIFQYYYGDQLVAADLCIKDGHCLIILKTTYDETITNSSPTMLMREEAFKYIFDEQLVERIEFYGKVMDWHTKWSKEIRSIYHINSYTLWQSLPAQFKRQILVNSAAS